MKDVIIQMKVQVDDDISAQEIENELCDISCFDFIESVLVEEQNKELEK